MMKIEILNADKRPLRFGVAIVFMTLVVLSACKKPESDLGLTLQPENELLGINQIDTVSILMYTLREDSLRSDELSSNLIGSYMDPEFGPTATSTYTQLLLDGQSVTFEEDDIWLDSAVLSLEYVNFYGKFDPQTFAVYQVTEDMYIDSAYYTNSFVNFDSSNNLIEPGYETVKPDAYKPVVVGADTLDPQLRLRLKNSWAQTIIDADEATVLASDDLFLDFMKGLHIRTENGIQANREGAIFYFDMEDAASKVTLYYRQLVNGDTIAKEFELLINDKCARFTKSYHDYSGYPVGNALADSTLNKAAYVQSLAGVKAVINFPYIKNLADSGMVGLNKAELILPADYYVASDQFPNSQLVLRTLDDEGKETFVSDAFNGITFGNSGIYDDEKVEYRIVITQYIQQLIKGDIPENQLRLVSTVSSVTANRCILSGPNSINRRKPRLILTYTKY